MLEYNHSLHEICYLINKCIFLSMDFPQIFMQRKHFQSVKIIFVRCFMKHSELALNNQKNYFCYLRINDKPFDFMSTVRPGKLMLNIQSIFMSKNFHNDKYYFFTTSFAIVVCFFHFTFQLYLKRMRPTLRKLTSLKKSSQQRKYDNDTNIIINKKNIMVIFFKNVVLYNSYPCKRVKLWIYTAARESC